MITHYIKVAMRHILKYKTQNLISIIGLSVGILCFSICLYCSRFIYDTDKCFTNHDRIGEIYLQYENGYPMSGLTPAVIDGLRTRAIDETEGFTFVSHSTNRDYNIEVAEDKVLPYNLRSIEIDSLFHRVFTPEVLLGSWEAASRTTHAIVMTRSTAERIFGDMNRAMGKSMQMIYNKEGANTAYTVQAVIEDIAENTSFSFLQTIEILRLNDTNGFINDPQMNHVTCGNGYALLHSRYTVGDLEARFRALDLKHNIFQKDLTMTVRPMGHQFSGEAGIVLLAFIPTALGVLILLTGLLNFFQFLIGTYLNRRREYGIRKVAGCNMSHLFAQLSVQAALISLFAFLITFCLIELLSPYLTVNFAIFTIHVDRNVLMLHAAEYMVGIFVLGMLLSLLTAWRVRKVTVMVGMNANTTRGGKHRMRNLLLGVQFFICFLFVSCTAALYLQAEKTSSTLLGTLTRQEKNDILRVSLDYRFMTYEQKEAVIQRLTQHNGVVDKMFAPRNFLESRSVTRVCKDKENPKENIYVTIMNVPHNFFDFLNIPFASGRTLETKEEAVIDQTLAAALKQAPLGTVLYNYSQKGYTVSGVVPEICASVKSNESGYFCILYDSQEELFQCYLKCAPGKADEVKAHAEQTLRELLPESIEPEVKTLMEDIAEASPVENGLKGVVLFFSVVSLIITLLGVYSAITLDTERRQKEVAIRKVNGAGMKQIVLLFARLYITLLLVTAAIALPIVYVITVLMKSMYTVFFNSGPVFWCGVFGFVAAVTALTVLFRILKIARINPAEVIKNE